MAKVYLDADIQAISGRLSKTTNASYARNKKTGKCYRYEYNVDTTYSNTTSQQAVRTAFATKVATAKAWWTTNKPASDDATPTAEWTAMLKAYDAQAKYGNKWVFVRSKLKSASTISFTDSTTSTTTSGSTDSGTSTGGTNTSPEM